MPSEDDPIVQISRWMARVAAISIAALLISFGLLALFREQGQPQLQLAQLLTTQGIVRVDLWGIVTAGLLIGLVWEGVGGALVVPAALTLYTYGLWQQPERFDAFALVCTLVGLADLFCWWRARKLDRRTRDASFGPSAHAGRSGNAGKRSPARAPFATQPHDPAPQPQPQPILTADGSSKLARPLPVWLPPWARRVDLNEVRLSIEAGPGGDVDAGGRLNRRGISYVPGLKRTVSAWIELHERVQRGDLGGADDGLAAPGDDADHAV